MKLTKDDIEYIRMQASQDRRKTRTISLNEDAYEHLMKYCRDNDLHVNRVIDSLIETYLEAVGAVK